MKNAFEKRAGFTIVELLVVIGILAMLTAILTPVVFQARASAKNAAIKAEIDMLHMAIMNYKNEYGSFPPCNVLTINGSDAASKHLQRIFPRCSTVATEFSTVLSGKNPSFITPGNSLAFWLSGYTANPMLPLTGGTRRKLFDMDPTRLDASTGLYWPSGKSGSPYIYIDSSSYLVSGTTQYFSQT
ncbi:MAG: type II secretion system protein, partial [Planctomycetia bacterium]